MNPAPEALPDVLGKIRSNRPFMRELAELLEQAQSQADRSGARCLGGGACCRFDLMEHRLYLTLAELALLTQPPLPDLSPVARRRCPWQRGPRCLARSNRPLGCRSFFCRQDPAIQSELYEHYLARMRELFRRHKVPYGYGELFQLLGQFQ
jgi:Fe-S-cluster containining protein